MSRLNGSLAICKDEARGLDFGNRKITPAAKRPRYIKGWPTMMTPRYGLGCKINDVVHGSSFCLMALTSEGGLAGPWRLVLAHCPSSFQPGNAIESLGCSLVGMLPGSREHLDVVNKCGQGFGGRSHIYARSICIPIRSGRDESLHMGAERAPKGPITGEKTNRGPTAYSNFHVQTRSISTRQENNDSAHVE